MTYKPTIGSVSHGTLRSEDLLSAFADELDRLKVEGDLRDLVDEARAVLTLLANGWTRLADLDETAELVNAMQDAIGEYAPPYCYFGTNEGEGSDFGYWPSMEAVDELPRVNDPADIPEGGTGEDCVYVNDHGNVTIYGADGAVIWDCV